MFEYLMVWMPLRTDHRAVVALECGLIAALIMGTIADAVALAGTNFAATVSTLATQV